MILTDEEYELYKYPQLATICRQLGIYYIGLYGIQDWSKTK